jgi:hypothetical protein
MVVRWRPLPTDLLSPLVAIAQGVARRVGLGEYAVVTKNKSREELGMSAGRDIVNGEGYSR